MNRRLPDYEEALLELDREFPAALAVAGVQGSVEPSELAEFVNKPPKDPPR